MRLSLRIKVFKFEFSCKYFTDLFSLKPGSPYSGRPPTGVTVTLPSPTNVIMSCVAVRIVLCTRGIPSHLACALLYDLYYLQWEYLVIQHMCCSTTCITYNGNIPLSSISVALQLLLLTRGISSHPAYVLLRDLYYLQWDYLVIQHM